VRLAGSVDSFFSPRPSPLSSTLSLLKRPRLRKDCLMAVEITSAEITKNSESSDSSGHSSLEKRIPESAEKVISAVNFRVPQPRTSDICSI